jgi:phosphohistidine phosphatase
VELILLRHGTAEDTNHDGDFMRVLVEKGRNQARRAALLLKNADILPDIVLTSPLIRARQTADAFCEAAEIPGAIIQGWLACGMIPETAMSELSAFRDFERVMLVGHEPDFSILVEWLLGCSGGGVKFKKGALASLSVSPPSRRGTLNYLIPSKLGGRMDRDE